MQKWKNEAGYTLIGALAIFTILAIVGVSLVTLTLASVKTSSSERQDQSVYYIAEAGLNHLEKKVRTAAEEVYNDVSECDELEIGMYEGEDINKKCENYFFAKLDEAITIGFSENLTDEDFDKIDGIENIFTDASVENIKKADDRIYTLVSTGSMDESERKVQKEIVIKWPGFAGGSYDLPPFAVFTSGQFTMSNGTITGDIGTISNTPGIISFPSGGPNLNGDIYVPNANETIVNNKVNNLNFEIKEISEEYTIPSLPPFPSVPVGYTKLPDGKLTHSDGNTTDLIKDNKLLIKNYITNNYTLNLKENLEFNSINLDQNNTLYIDVGDDDKEIVVDHLNIVNGHIKLKGVGNLTIYVTEKITMGSGSHINADGDIGKLNIFYSGSQDIILAGDQKIYGSIYSEKANMKLTGSGGIYGNIFSGGYSIEMTGGSKVESQLVLAPNADVKMTGGGALKGRIISKTFDNSGGANVTLIEPFIIDGPISPAALGKDYEQGGGDEGGSPNPDPEASDKKLIIDDHSPIREID